MPQANFEPIIGVNDGKYLTISPSTYTIPTKFVNGSAVYLNNLFPTNITATITTILNGRVVETRQATNLTFSKQYIDIYDAIACFGDVNNRIRVTVTSEGASAYLDIICDIKKPQSIEMVVTDAETYAYGGGGNYWTFYPTSIEVTQVKVTYNDGTVETISDPNWNGVVYKTNDPHSQSDVYTNGANEIEKAPSFGVWLTYSPTNSYVNDGKQYDLWYEHFLTIVPAVIDHFEFSNQPSTIVQAHKLNKYKGDFTLVAVDQFDEEFVLRPEQYSFADEYIFGVSTISSIDIVVNGEEYTVDLDESITVEEATISEVIQRWSGGAAKTTYEEFESFNFSNCEFEIHYEGTDFVSVATFYGETGYGFAIEFEGLTASTAFDGTTTLDELGLSASNSGSTMTFTIDSPATSETIEIEKTITILDISNIASIEIESPYRNYEVGDLFLKNEDTTVALIRYYDSNEQLQTKRIPLNSGYSKIVVEPAKNDLLNVKTSNQMVRVSSAFDSSINTAYWISVSAKKVNDKSMEMHCRVEYYDGFTMPDGSIYTPENGNGLLVIYTEDGESIGWIENINDDKQNAKVVLFNDYLPEVQGSSNITVLYPFYEEDLAKEINECHFGVLFGSNNAKNRLFLSGNPSIYNADWHSSEPNYNDYEDSVILANGNFSYFSDESIMYYGETDNKVIGYEVVSNDKLLVLKDKSDKEKTVYFRNPTIVTAIDASGTSVKGYDDETLYQEEFSLTKGNNSVAGISPKSIVNFNGETLFLDSNNELVGLDVAGIIGDNQRYANTRSLYIDRMLNNMDLTESVLWTNNNYLFVTVKDFGVFATNYKTYNSETKQYEWFFLTSENPTAFIEVGKTIYFANEKGELYKYSQDDFRDIKKVFSSHTLQYYNGQLIVEPEVIAALEDEPNEDYTFKTIIDKNASYQEKVFFSLAKMSSSTSGDADIFIDNTKHRLEVKNSNLYLVDGYDYYLDGLETVDVNAGQTDLQNVAGVKFRLKQISTEGEIGVGDCFHLYKVVDGEEVEVTITDFTSARLFGCLEDSEAEVVGYHKKDPEDNSDYNTITLARNDRVLVLYTYASQPVVHSFKSEIRKCKNVEAFYMTAPFVMGGLDKLKTIWSFTITNDFAIPSQIEVAYASNKIPLVDMKKMSYISLSREQIGWDFSSLNFHKVDFDKDVVPRTYTFNRILAYQKFICFVFRNYDNTNAVLSAMSVSYTTPYPSYSGD